MIWPRATRTGTRPKTCAKAGFDERARPSLFLARCRIHDLGVELRSSPAPATSRVALTGLPCDDGGGRLTRPRRRRLEMPEAAQRILWSRPLTRCPRLEPETGG